VPVTEAQRREVEALFAAHGYRGPLRTWPVTSEDERIFVLPRAQLDALSDTGTLVPKLQQALGRKVWVVHESSPRAPDPVPF